MKIIEKFVFKKVEKSSGEVASSEVLQRRHEELRDEKRHKLEKGIVPTIQFDCQKKETTPTAAPQITLSEPKAKTLEKRFGTPKIKFPQNEK